MRKNYEEAGSWPGDLIEVDISIFNEFSAQPVCGKARGVNEKGEPAWVDLDPMSKVDQVEKANSLKILYRGNADKAIAPLQDASDLNLALESEISALNEWKKYRVLLSRIDTSEAPNIDWPIIPTS